MSSQRKPVYLAWLLILVTWAACYLPSFSLAECQKEESRRALPAREMIASGDYIVPTIWGQPYLAKPPLFYWTIAGAAALTGEVTTFSARLPAVLATLLTALALFHFGRRMFDARSGLAAALLFLLSLGTFEKGAMAELEATLCFYVFVATASLWVGRDGSRGALALGTLALVGATLTKGPVGFLFYGAAGVAIALETKSWRYLRSARFVLPAAASGLALGAWAWLVLQRVDAAQTLEHWGGELVRTNDNAMGLFLRDRWRFVTGMLAAFFPGSLICLLLLPAWRSKLPQLAAERIIAWALVAALLVLCLQPGVRPRFAYGALPWCALLAGRWLESARTTGLHQHLGLRSLAGVVAFLGVAVSAASCYVFVRPIEGVGPYTPAGYLLVALLLVASSVAAWRARRSFDRRTLVAAACVLGLMRVVQLTEITPQVVLPRPSDVAAAAIDAQVPAGETIEVRFWSRFNELVPVVHELRYVAVNEDIRAGAYLLVFADEVEELARAGRILGQFDLGGSRGVALVAYD